MNKQENTDSKSIRRRLSGIVVSDKNKNTIVVSVTRYVRDPRYKKYVRKVKRYMAHDQENSCVVGDKVLIEETRPISKRKRFKVVS